MNSGGQGAGDSSGSGGSRGPGGPDGPGGGTDSRAPRTLRQRFSALGNLGPFLKLVWEVRPAAAVAAVLLRLARALLPVATLYVGKLILDAVVGLAGADDRPASFAA